MFGRCEEVGARHFGKCQARRKYQARRRVGERGRKPRLHVFPDAGVFFVVFQVCFGLDEGEGCFADGFVGDLTAGVGGSYMGDLMAWRTAEAW